MDMGSFFDCWIEFVFIKFTFYHSLNPLFDVKSYMQVVLIYCNSQIINVIAFWMLEDGYK